MRLTADWIRSGIVRCPDCNRDFEATVFDPPKQILRVVEVTQAGPDGGSSCANHPGNAAVTSCRRCGLFICALCDMNVGDGSYCPSCFDRIREEGTLPATTTKFRDYAAMARIAMLAGVFFTFLFLGPIFGAVGLHYARRAIRQRRTAGEGAVGPTFSLIFAILEIIGGLAWIAIAFGAMRWGK